MTFKQIISSNTVTVGSWITVGHPAVAEIMAHSGFDWLTIDLEHSAITLSEAQELIRVIDLCGVHPMVRVGENNPNLIKRVMDAGAHGVIVPMVNTPEEAEMAVNAVKYPPNGKRGVGLARAQQYGFGFDRYKDWVEQESVVIVQIEHIQAIGNLERILSVPGVDGSLIGPYDLSGSLGNPGDFEMKEVRDALERYETVSKKLNSPMGFHIVQPDPSKYMELEKQGYSFLAIGLDTLFLGGHCREVVSKVKDHEQR